MICPSCGLQNAPSAERCDCGHILAPELAGAPTSDANTGQPNPTTVKQKCILSGILSGGIVLLTSVLATRNGWPGWSYLVATLISAPGIYISRWFMPTRFATPVIRLMIIGTISAFFIGL